MVLYKMEIVSKIAIADAKWSTGTWMLKKKKKKKSARPTLFCTGPLLQYKNFFFFGLMFKMLRASIEMF